MAMITGCLFLGPSLADAQGRLNAADSGHLQVRQYDVIGIVVQRLLKERDGLTAVLCCIGRGGNFFQKALDQPAVHLAVLNKQYSEVSQVLKFFCLFYFRLSTFIVRRK